MPKNLSHLDVAGQACMVDVAGKAETFREARACASVSMSREAMAQLVAGNNKKGDVIGVSRIAGIQAAKKCSELMPLCHQLMLSSVQVDFEIDQANQKVKIVACCKVKGVTGVEMEALTAASVAALNLYDMCKAVDKGIIISSIALLEKQGGKSGHWSRAKS